MAIELKQPKKDRYTKSITAHNKHGHIGNWNVKITNLQHRKPSCYIQCRLSQNFQLFFGETRVSA